MNTFKALCSRRFILPTIVVLLGMALLAWLGFWQLDRLEQRRAENAVLAIALAQPPLELTSDGVADGVSVNDVSLAGNQQAIAHGVFDFDEQVVLRLQLNEEGRTGLHLLTPLRLDDETGDSQTAVLVDRGWIPEDAQADYNAPVGETAVYGYLAAAKPQLEPNNAPQKEWHRVDVEAIAAQLPYELLPFYLVQLNEEQSAADPLPIRGKLEVDLSDGPHLSYAMQWFLFSLTLAVVYVAFVYKQVGKGDTDSTDLH